MKRSADVVDISEDEDSCSTTLEPQDPDLEAPRKRSRVDEFTRELISAVRLLHQKTKIQVQWMLCRMRPLNFTLRFATINVRVLSRKKFELVTDFFHTSQLDFCFIQETMISLESKIAPFSASWSGPNFGNRRLLREAG